MKNKGIIKAIDQLGRIVIPGEMRAALDISLGDKLELAMEKDKIVIKKHTDSCVFCGSESELFLFKDRIVCKKCAKEISEE